MPSGTDFHSPSERRRALRARALGTVALLAAVGAGPAQEPGLAALAESSTAVSPPEDALARAAAERDPVAIALSLVGGAAGARSLQLESLRDSAEGAGRITVIIVRDGLLDDATRGDWHRVELAPAPESGGWSVTSLRRAVRCWPGRGADGWRDQICR